jgi:hypothetical protein
VLEAAVLRQPDAIFGEQLVALVALRPSRSVAPDRLIEHCRGSWPGATDLAAVRVLGSHGAQAISGAGPDRSQIMRFGGWPLS